MPKFYACDLKINFLPTLGTYIETYLVSFFVHIKCLIKVILNILCKLSNHLAISAIQDNWDYMVKWSEINFLSNTSKF